MKPTEQEADALDDATAIRLGRLITERESFIVLCDLVQERNPVSAAMLARDYGTDVAGILEILALLMELGFATRKGQAYAATPAARFAVGFLEKAVERVEIPPTAEGVAGEDSLIMNFSSASGTNNGDGHILGEAVALTMPTGRDAATPEAVTVPSAAEYPGAVGLPSQGAKSRSV